MRHGISKNTKFCWIQTLRSSWSGQTFHKNWQHCKDCCDVGRPRRGWRWRLWLFRRRTIHPSAALPRQLATLLTTQRKHTSPASVRKQTANQSQRPPQGKLRTLQNTQLLQNISPRLRIVRLWNCSGGVDSEHDPDRLTTNTALNTWGGFGFKSC